MELLFKIICLIQSLDFGTSFVFSNFRRSDIFHEIMDIGLIKSEPSDSWMACAKECSRDKNCRRIKFCDNGVTSGQCLTYDEGQNCPHNTDGQKCLCYQKVLSYEDGVYTCPVGYYGDRCENVIKHCSDGNRLGMDILGVKLSFIQPDGAAEPFEVLCEFRYGGLTFIQHRHFTASPVDFNRTLDDYINGFGRPRYNHWLGLKRISLISKNSATKCNIELIDASYAYCQIYYDTCHIFGEADDYKIRLDDYSLNSALTQRCGDSLTRAVDNVDDAPFSAYDVDFTNNDCAAKMGAGWWYAQSSTCNEGNLNAPLASTDEVAADPGVPRMKWYYDLGDDVIKISNIKMMRTDV